VRVPSPQRDAWSAALYVHGHTHAKGNESEMTTALTRPFFCATINGVLWPPPRLPPPRPRPALVRRPGRDLLHRLVGVPGARGRGRGREREWGGVFFHGRRPRPRLPPHALSLSPLQPFLPSHPALASLFPPPATAVATAHAAGGALAVGTLAYCAAVMLGAAVLTDTPGYVPPALRPGRGAAAPAKKRE